jgi:hypothetical protein
MRCHQDFKFYPWGGREVFGEERSPSGLGYQPTRGISRLIVVSDFAACECWESCSGFISHYKKELP